MDIDLRREGADRLGSLVRRLAADGITDHEGYRRWRSTAPNRRFLADVLGLPALPGLPDASALLGVDFHPELPLVLLNYSPVAHNVLHGTLHAAWTPALRMARGTVVDRSGRLVAHPFPKFFNYGKSPETMTMPAGPWTAGKKMDGHLAINFEFDGTLRATTRGRFQSPSSLLANRLVRAYLAEKRWDARFPPNLTVLAELIGPETRVFLDYDGEPRYVLIGAFDRGTFYDLAADELDALGADLGLPVAERWAGISIDALIARMQDLSVEGEEGYVARFGDTRIKLKYASYINRMVEAKLSYAYLMARIRDGKLDEMIRFLEEEVLERAHAMIGALMRVQFMPGTKKARREYLYGLLPEEQRNKPYYRGLCGKFLGFIDAGWNPPATNGTDAD